MGRWPWIVIFLVVILAFTGLAQGSRRILINLPAYTLYLYEDHLPLRSYPIAVGQVVSPSLLGERKIINKVVDPTYYPPDWYLKGLEPIPPGPDNPVGTRWLGLDLPGYGIHGTNRPSSIGSAVSAGCIRMLNRDVEELTEMVTIGTPVEFLYETVLVGLDPLRGKPYIIVYPDIYGRAGDPLSLLWEKLSQLSIGPIHRDFLTYIVQRPTGKPQPIPLALPLYWEGELVATGVLWGEEILVPLEPLEERGKLMALPGTGAIKLGSTTLLPLAEAKKRLGLCYYWLGASPDFHRIRLGDGEELLPVLTFVVDNELYVEADPLAQRYHVPLAWDSVERRLSIDGQRVDYLNIGGRAFISTATVEDYIGIRCIWEPEAPVAWVARPRVIFQGQLLTEEAYLSPQGPLVPLRPLMDRLGWRLSWDGQTAIVDGYYRLEGRIRGGRIYVALKDLQKTIPGWRYRWDPDSLEVMIEYEGPGSPALRD
ncbi:MAG: L,D-transpeptidase family protein [Limnochordia bacterium]